jgi:hypothetical protein
LIQGIEFSFKFIFRVKNLSFFSDINVQKEFFGELKNLITTVEIDTIITLTFTSGKNSYELIFGKNYSLQYGTITTDQEFKQYRNMNEVSMNENPLHWWNNYATQFSQLTKLAQK